MAAAAMERAYLSPPEVGEILGISPEKVIRLIRAGELPGIDVASRDSRRPRFRIARDDLDRWLKCRAVGHATPALPPRPKLRSKWF